MYISKINGQTTTLGNNRKVANKKATEPNFASKFIRVDDGIFFSPKTIDNICDNKGLICIQRNGKVKTYLKGISVEELVNKIQTMGKNTELDLREFNYDNKKLLPSRGHFRGPN